MKTRHQPRVLAMIMAGGKGERLMPLTQPRSKPAVPFGGQYRIIDFVLSNFLNSGIEAVYVLVQYRSQSLIEHLRLAWRNEGRSRHHFITVVPPQMRTKTGWYAGTADAVHQNVNLIRDFAPDFVAVFGADHIYRMDVSQMVHFHKERAADVTVGALPVPIHAATEFGIIEVGGGSQADHILGFEEKPSSPKPMPANPDYAFSSLGNYLFSTDVLLEALEADGNESGSHDFGKTVIPRMIGRQKVLAYNLMHNDVPGLQPFEERGYWRDVGNLEAYWQANMDILGEEPIFDLRNPAWPILAEYPTGPAASLVRSRLDDVMIGQGSHVVEANIRRSVIGRNVRIERGVDIEGCVILDDVVIGSKARLRRVVADRAGVIEQATEIGYNQAADSRRFKVSQSGLVVLPLGTRKSGSVICNEKPLVIG